MELIKCGQWTFREDELSFKDFNRLNKQDREEYLDLLKGLPDKECSTTDLIIIDMFIKEKKKAPKFLEL